MRLPHVIESHVAPDEAVYTLTIPPDSDVFEGHFPGKPILPGVAQVDWATQFAAQSWGVPAVARNFQVKFRNIISPGATITLTLRYDRAKLRVHFEYRSAEHVKSLGRIDVEPAR
jgi:3-hydroxymyristoyl/3-hydroxydecanoyl-(acyl carrier protein) dehydratase